MTITLYTTTTCPYCKTEKEFFKSKNVAFKEILVDQDEKAAEEMIKLTGQYGVPVTVVEKDGTKDIVVGWDKRKLSELVEIV